MIFRQFSNVSKHLLRHLNRKSTINHLSSRTLSIKDIQDVQSCEHFKFTGIHRTLIQLDGSECHEFLQGLITNDVRHLSPDGQTGLSRNCIYAFMLNSSGKIVTDCFVYSLPGHKDLLLLDVDANLCSKIVALLKRYKIRRKINIHANPNYEVFAIFPEGHNIQLTNEQFQYSSEEIIFVQDPRNHNFGYRMIRKRSNDLLESNRIVELFNKHNHNLNASFKSVPTDEYDIFRYQTGFGEGAKDFIPETIYPFEANAELLNGVSFQKGCYIGQELTARTYHTGVIRKRILPIKLVIAYHQRMDLFPVQNVVTLEGNKIVGRFRCNHGNIGLAVLKYGQIFSDNKTTSETMILTSANVHMHAIRPFWWPDSVQ